MLNHHGTSWDEIDEIPVGHQIGSSQLLFSKMEDDTIEKQILNLKHTSMKIGKIIILAFILTPVNYMLAQCDGRYENEIFVDVDTNHIVFRCL